MAREDMLAEFIRISHGLDEQIASGQFAFLEVNQDPGQWLSGRHPQFRPGGNECLTCAASHRVSVETSNSSKMCAV
jgi:hypothetical protein